MSLEAEARAAMPDGIRDAQTAVSGGETALTPRQSQILALIQSGKSNKEIAADLGIGLGTVKQHINGLFRKLDVSNRTMAVQRATTLPTATDGATDAATSHPLETRPAVVLAITLAAEGITDLSTADGAREALDFEGEPDADPTEALHATLAGVASHFAATFLPRRDGGDFLFGLHRCREHDIARAIRAAFAITHEPGLAVDTTVLRMGVETGIVAAGMTADGHWDGQIAAGPLLQRARTQATESPAGHLTLGSAARDRLAAFCGLREPPHGVFDLGAHEVLPYDIPPARGGLHGRGRETGILEADIDTARATGRGHATLIEGEAGIGKTALLATLPELCGDAGVTLEQWRCLPADGQPLTAARGHLMNVTTGDMLEARAFIARLTDDASDDAPDDSLPTALGPPAHVMVADDVHNLPRPMAVSLFKAAATAARRGRLVVLAARPLVSASIGPIPDGRQIRLGRLDRLAMEALVESVVTAPLRPDACAAICDRAAGVPLFGVELARAVDGAGVLPTDPPLAVLALLVARIDGFRLDHRLLHLLAERPGVRRVDALRETWPGSPGAFDTALAAAAASGLVTRQDRPHPTVTIAHPMIFAVLHFVMTHWKTSGGTV